jgi:hypothetical protein
MLNFYIHTPFRPVSDISTDEIIYKAVHDDVHRAVYGCIDRSLYHKIIVDEHFPIPIVIHNILYSNIENV